MTSKDEDARGGAREQQQLDGIRQVILSKWEAQARWISTDESPPFFLLSLALPELLNNRDKMAKTFIEFEGQKLLLQKNFYGVEPFISSCDLCCMNGAFKCHLLNCDEWDGEHYSCYYVIDEEPDMPFPKSAKTPQAKRGGGRQDK